MILISIFISNLTGVSAGYIFILSAYFITKNGIQLIQNSFFGGREAASSCPALLHAVHIYFIVLTNKLYFIVIKSAFSSDICFADFFVHASQHFRQTAVLLTFFVHASQHFRQTAVLLTFFIPASQHFHQTAALLTFFVPASQHFYQTAALLTFYYIFR